MFPSILPFWRFRDPNDHINCCKDLKNKHDYLYPKVAIVDELVPKNQQKESYWIGQLKNKWTKFFHSFGGIFNVVSCCNNYSTSKTCTIKKHPNVNFINVF